MASASKELQEMQYAQLSTLAIGAAKIFDGVAPVSEQGPFIVFGQDNFIDIGDKSNRGWQVLSRFTVHSDLASFTECKDIAGQIMDLFHEQTFTTANFQIWGARFATENYSIEEIGLTRRGDADYTFWITD